MKVKGSSLQTFYLRSGGLVSASLGSLSITAFIFGWFQGVAGKGLGLVVFAITAAVLGNVIGKDILDRVRNGENIEVISNLQQRFAWIGTRAIFALTIFFVVFLLVSIAPWFILQIERVSPGSM